eukprot:scaffold4511_cov171-Amphora_coffeaeformis.AAC.11
MTTIMYQTAPTTAATGASYSNTATTTLRSASSSWSETALDWWQRSRQHQQHQAKLLEQAKTPSAAARAFVLQPLTGCLPFLVSQIQQRSSSLSGHPKRRRRTPFTPLVECSGLVGKTTTLLTLAAQFVVQTRPSRFPNYHSPQQNNSHAADGVLLPQVFVLDSTWEISASQIHKVVRSSLLCDYDTMATATSTSTTTIEGSTTEGDEPTLTPPQPTNSDDHDVEERLAEDCQACLQRIHVAYADENTTAGWLPILESLAAHLAEASRHHPTLVLWDGLGERDKFGGTELQRTLLRWMREFHVMVVYTTTHPLPRHKEWDDRVTRRIRLEKVVTGASTAPDFVAQYHV